MNFKQGGQAAVEYLFVLVFMVMISITIIGRFKDFFRTSMGNLGHELSVNLLVGICRDACFYPGYKNGYQP